MNENRQLVALLLILMLSFGFGFYFLNKERSSTQTTIGIGGSNLNDSAIAPREVTEGNLNDIELRKETPENAFKFQTVSGTASYVVKKRFLVKDDIEVVGTASDVSGAGWLNSDSGALYFKSIVNLEDLKTDSSQRDADLLRMLKSTTATLELDLEASAVKPGEAFEIEVPATLTINEETKEINLKVKGNINEEEFSASGVINTSISEFGLEPPSLVNVFEVEDPLELRFEVLGKRVM